MNCDCIKTIDTQLAERNTKLAVSFVAREVVKEGKRSIEFDTGLSVEVAKIDPKKRGKALSVLVSFCPFCGKSVKPVVIGPHEEKEGGNV